MSKFTHIVVTRNPRTKRLIPLVNDDDSVREFDSRDEANIAGNSNVACSAWGFEVLEVSPEYL